MNRRQTLIVPFLLVAAGLLGGCSSLQEQRDLSEQMRGDQLKFYQYLANSYYVLGYEYYALARDLDKNGDSAMSQHMARRAKIYYDLSADLSLSAELLAKRYDIPASTGPLPALDTLQPAPESAAAEPTAPAMDDAPAAAEPTPEPTP